ncbi:MAG: YifB family Mg chelatase-like AAA ATPase [bacterium]|nr:YifB family Mg chelatase-like AAA ATPase [bacterium]
MVTKAITATTVGINAYKIEVEVDVTNSLPAVCIVGLPDSAVNEAKERVHSAIKNSGYTFPTGKVIVNLAPADIRKEGTNFDLPIAVGILKEQGIEIPDKEDIAFIGELSRDGSLRRVNGVLPLVAGLKEHGVNTVFVPIENAKEAALVQDIKVFGAKDLREVVEHFSELPLTQTIVDINKYLEDNAETDYSYDFKDVKGQQKAKRAMEIAAAGGHNLLMTGTPGSGKTMMAKCMASILPPLELSEALELTKIYSISGLLSNDEPLMTKRPYRSVHHTASQNGIIGGGTNPKPGEITLAHRGVLFLDEMVEFPRPVLEVLRQPIEDGEVVISRSKLSIKYPCRFMLVGAMNPCPCGFLGDREKQCTCTDIQVQRYRSRLSGPLLDRIDLVINVPRLTTEELINTKSDAEPSKQIRERVVRARKLQAKRYEKDGILTNSELSAELIKKYCKLDDNAQNIMKMAAQKYQLSGRKYNRVLKIARTIADLSNSENITSEHLTQALQYRSDN